MEQDVLYTTQCSLSDAELLALDGKCRPNIQPFVEGARVRTTTAKKLAHLPEHLAKLVADIVARAVADKRLVYQHRSIDKCPVCKRNDGYYTRKRASRYHRKGSPDYSKPKYFGGTEFRDSFIRIQGHISCGGCSECVAAVKADLVAELQNIEAELPEALMGIPPRFKRFDNMKCSKCEWTGHQGEMRMLPAMMGGYFPGGCPTCEAENSMFVSLIKCTEGHTLAKV